MVNLTDHTVSTKPDSLVPRAYLNSISISYLHEIQKEKAIMANRFPLTSQLIEHAIDKVHTSGRIPGKTFHCDITKPLPMKLTQRVCVPVKQFPKFNFTGKILGPKGNSLRRLEEATQCKICIKGRNSMRDPDKEDELRNSSEPKYAHLQKDLFVEISTVGSPIECYDRLSKALEEIRQYLVPDKNDRIGQEQSRELQKNSRTATELAATESPLEVVKSEDQHSSTDVQPMEVEDLLQGIKRSLSPKSVGGLRRKHRMLIGPKLRRFSIASKTGDS